LQTALKFHQIYNFIAVPDKDELVSSLEDRGHNETKYVKK